MSRFNEENIQGNSEFLEFIKKEYGYDSYDAVPFWNKSALLYKFKALNNDMDPEDLEFVNQGHQEYYETLSDVYFPGKKFEELSTEDKIFVQAVSREVVTEKDLEAIREFAKGNEFSFGQNTAETSNKQVLDNVQNNEAADETVIGQVNEEDNDRIKEVEINGQIYRGETSIGKNDLRERSPNSDENEFLMDKTKLKTYLDMGIINEDIYNAGIAHPTAAIEKLQEVRPLNDEETVRFDETMLDNILQQEGLLELTPPSVLAEQYERLQQKRAEKLAADENADVSAEDLTIGTLENRMLALSNDFYNEEKLFYQDATNVGDTYEGYMKMTDVLDKYVAEPEQDEEKKAQLKEVLNTNRETLNTYIDDYDAEWNLENATPERAEEVNKRFDEISPMLDKVEIDEETLALVSNFKFMTNGEVEQPFVNKQGEKSSTYTPGATIDPESKLATVVRIAKQNAMQSTIAGTDEITQESLNKEVSDQLGAALYSFSVGDKVVHGVLENPKAFTDETQRQEFLDNLRNANEPTYLSEEGFEAGVDSSINQSAAYASRLNKKLGKDNPVANQVAVKTLEPLKDLDKRAADRTTDKKMTKREARIALAKRGLKGAVSAFLVSGAITVAATATATDATLTAATGGMNKLAGAAIGTGLAITAAAMSIRKWRKQRKAEGKPRGLMSMLKDPRLATTLATTALGGAALGFAATGNPGVAMACGSAALTVGAGSNAVFTAKDARKMGLSKAEALGWGVVNAAATVAAGFGGRATANAAIDLYNQHNPDNTTFQHKEKIGSHTEEYTEQGTRTVIDYGALNENAQEFLQDNWYKDNPELLQQRIDALTAAGVENPHHALLIAHDAGLRAPDNMQMWDGSTSHGNHTVLTHSWAEQNGVNPDSVDAFKHLFNNDGSVNSDAIAAYKEVAPHVGEDNFVSRIEDRPVIRELYGDRESTYDHEHKLPMKEETYDITKTKTVDDYGMVRNDNGNVGVGMVGMLASPFKAAKKLKERVGSLLDKIVRPKKKELPPAPAPVVHEVIQEEPVSPVVVPPVKEEPVPVTVINEEDPNKKLLIDEYKIVYGIEPNTEEGKDTKWKEYCKRVEEERQVGASDKSLNEFLLDRRARLDKVIANGSMSNPEGDLVRKDYEVKKLRDDRGHAKEVMHGRQSLMQSNLTNDNYNNKITLSHFTKYMEHFTVRDAVVADGSRDIKLNPQLKDKYKDGTSKVDIIDLNAYLVDGKPLEESKEKVSGKDAREAMARLSRFYER